MKDYNIFRALRGCLGMTIDEMSNRSGVSGVYLYDLEHGTKRKPSDGVLAKIAGACGLELETIQFFMETPEVNYPVIFLSALKDYARRKQKGPKQTRWLVDVKDLLEKEFYLCEPFSQRPKVVSVFDIVTAPPVDAVEVVRCRDCKHGKPNGKGTYYCYQDKFTIRLDLKPDHYCADGDRRDDA